MTDSQVVAIVDHDQFKQIIEQPSTSQQSSERHRFQGWRQTLKMPRITKNHLTVMMVICIAVSCFITVFSLLMVIIPFISEVSKFQKMAKERADWSDRSSYRTVIPSEDKLRLKRSPQKPVNPEEIKRKLESGTNGEQCYVRVNQLFSRLTQLLEYYSFKDALQLLSLNQRQEMKEIYERCLSADEKRKIVSELGISKISDITPGDMQKLALILGNMNRGPFRSSAPRKKMKGEADAVSMKSGKMTDPFPPTGPDMDVSAPGEAVKTSQQLTVSLPQVMQQTCVLKPPSVGQFPPAAPTYVCYPGPPPPALSPLPQQPVHVPTAISSPNPYYFPTVSGSPLINPFFQPPESPFNPVSGTVQLSPPSSASVLSQYPPPPLLQPPVTLLHNAPPPPLSPHPQQPVHVPTAVSSPNPYYFPTVSGSPLINPVSGTGQLSPPSSASVLSQYPPPPLLRPPVTFLHNAPPPLYPPVAPQPRPPVLQTLPPSYSSGSPTQGHLQLLCSYHPAPGSPYQVYSFPPVPGVSSRSFNSQPQIQQIHPKTQKFAESGSGGECGAGQVKCGEGSDRCIPASSVCDSKVDCPDGEDESSCSCQTRIPFYKLCDGYADCPAGQDETTGCHGCGERSFSCDDLNSVRGVTCVPMEARCDGVHQCPNGKDEMDCVLLADQLLYDWKYFVSYNEGYLHRNWRGVWYPVCMDTGNTELARQACQAEHGYRHYRDPIVSLTTKGDEYRGLFLQLGESSMSVVKSCYGDKAVYVRCPTVHCGRQRQHGDPSQSNRPYRKTFPANDTLHLFPPRHPPSADSHKDVRREREEVGRVVGGRRSEPGRWPWVVAIYRDGVFHCGGVIIDKLHILTAAHCFTMHKNHYYEVRAGILRRYSFSPHEQIRTVETVYIHDQYNQNTMQNDICVVKLDKELKLNRWVSVVCVPFGDYSFPLPGDSCTAVGWGATREHGPDPDEMQEVEVPILARCKHKVDREAGELCAGAVEGGRDTCQGDSGGPLLCRQWLGQGWSSVWYVSGVVSHGEGCARPDEPGAYTRVTLYSSWIISVVSGKKSGGTVLGSCPGKSCYDGRCVADDSVCDGRVDCLSAEDETDCPVGQDDSHSSESMEIISPSVYVLRDHQVIKEDQNETTEAADSTSTASTSTASLPSLSPSPSPRNSEAALPTFHCNKYGQQIREEFRCDDVVDCADASDELNCTCRQVLSHRAPDLICDSRVDCYDATDEHNCTSNRCPEDFAYLPRSKQCIPKELKCNLKADYPDAEDEENCFFLVPDLSNVQYDELGRVVPSLEGVIMHRVPNITFPVPACVEGENITTQPHDHTIQLLGFGEWREYQPVSFPGIPVESCTGLYGVARNYAVFGPRAPWLASVSVEGRTVSTAVLIHPSWLLMPFTPPFDNPTKVGRLYASCRLGFLNVSAGPPGPLGVYEKTVRVDRATALPQLRLTLLRLDSPLHSSDGIKPLQLLEQVERGGSDRCFAVGVESSSLIHILRASRQPSPRPDAPPHVSYTVQPRTTTAPGGGVGAMWSGAVWCVDAADKPYLDCVFSNTSVCTDACTLNCTSVFQHYPHLLPIIGSVQEDSRDVGRVEGREKRGDQHNETEQRQQGAGRVERGYQFYGDNYDHDYREWENDYTSQNAHSSFGHMRDLFDSYMFRDYNTEDRGARQREKTIMKRESSGGREKRQGHRGGGQVLHEEVEEEEEESSFYEYGQNEHEHEQDINYHMGDDYPWKRHSSTNETVGQERTNHVYIKQMTASKETSLRKETADHRTGVKVIEFDVGTEAVCRGVRCRGGTCVPWSHVHDGISTCKDGQDEDVSINKTAHCLQHPHDCKECGSQELSCGDGDGGGCIGVEKFCDGVVDCPTQTDEPESCSTNCSSYLALRNPSWLCDGIPNCFDGTDESWTTCGSRTLCTLPNAYRCHKSSGCVNEYQVCDGVRDCPLGDDELTCAAVQSRPGTLWEGVLVGRYMGRWTPLCLDQQLPNNQTVDVCTSLGWQGVNTTRYQTTTTLRPSLEPYSTLSLNPRAQYALHSHRPPLQLTPVHHCLTLHITCY